MNNKIVTLMVDDRTLDLFYNARVRHCKSGECLNNRRFWDLGGENFFCMLKVISVGEDGHCAEFNPGGAG